MSNDLTKKFDRIVSIFVQLQSKRIVKAQELADKFSVSIRTIYRDIKSLEQAGVPVLSEAGIGYSIMEGYKLPPVMLTKEEAISFVTAEMLMEKYVDKTMGTHYKDAMSKIKSVLRWSEKDYMSLINDSLYNLPSSTIFGRSANNALEILMNGITLKRQVSVTYKAFDSDKEIKRILEPIGIFHENEYWYLVAYCMLRKDYRQFRTDRILNLQLTENSFALEHQSLEDYIKTSKEKSNLVVDICITAHKSVTKYMVNSMKNYGFVNQESKGDDVLMYFKVRDSEIDYFIRWYLMYGDAIKLISPVSLKEKIRDLMFKIEANL